MLGQDTIMHEIPVALGREVSYVVGSRSSTMEVMLTRYYNEERLDISVSLAEEGLVAHVEKGQILGEVSVTYDGQDYGSVPLVAVSAVERSFPLWIFSQIHAALTSVWFLLLVVAVVTFVVLRYLRALRRVPRKKR